MKAKLMRRRDPQHHRGDGDHDAANQAGLAGGDMPARRVHSRLPFSKSSRTLLVS